ncbi:MAG: hypothetical protein KDJ29_06845 [Hyphomicrobiales bacterium]|nr:hypothetical protein [Hyphomicrobiales bacterium]
MATIDAKIGKSTTAAKGVLAARRVLIVAAVATVAAIGTGFSAQTSATAVAATGDSAAPLTITRKPARDLTPEPGIRLAKISSTDGVSCFRASRALPGAGRTISERFCTHF